MHRYSTHDFFSVLVALTLVGCSPESEHVVVSGTLLIPENTRVLIKSPEPLKTPNYWNSVCLLPEEPTVLAQLPKFGFVGLDGAAFLPKIFVRNAAGMEDPLPIVGNLGSIDGIWLCFQPEGSSQKLHSPYTEVVLMSSEAISIKSIKWHSSDK